MLGVETMLSAPTRLEQYGHANDERFKCGLDATHKCNKGGACIFFRAIEVGVVDSGFVFISYLCLLFGDNYPLN